MGMCSRDETLEIVADSERRIIAMVHEEISKLRVEVRADRESSHMAVSKTISNLGKEFVDAVKELKDWRREIEGDVQALKTWQTGHEVEAKYISQKIDELYGVAKWILTLVGGAVILAGLNLILI